MWTSVYHSIKYLHLNNSNNHLLLHAVLVQANDTLTCLLSIRKRRRPCASATSRCFQRSWTACPTCSTAPPGQRLSRCCWTTHASLRTQTWRVSGWPDSRTVYGSVWDCVTLTVNFTVVIVMEICESFWKGLPRHFTWECWSLWRNREHSEGQLLTVNFIGVVVMEKCESFWKGLPRHFTWECWSLWRSREHSGRTALDYKLIRGGCNGEMWIILKRLA